MGNTILLADKSVTIQKIVELTFADEQYEIKCVNDGQSALDAIPQVHPDIILADISLPVKDGYEICQILRKDPAYAAYSNIPVILLAGIYETMDEERAKKVEERVREVGANDLLSKPFDPQILTTKVKDLMSASTGPVFREQPLAEQATEGSLFSEAPAASSEIFAETMEGGVAESDYSFEETAEDTEKTMMLPGKPVFSSSVFAESSPFESEEPQPSSAPPVNIDEVKPVDEPIFEAEQMEQAGAYEEEELLEEPMKEETDFSEGSSFVGKEEPIFEMPASEVVPEEELPFGASVGPPQTTPPIYTSGEEPFGDVFEEPMPSVSWTASTASEEEAPFGLPEPPPSPPEPEVQEATPAVMMKDTELPPAEELWTPAPSTEPLTLEEQDREELEEIIGEPAKPDFGEDTWSRAQAQAKEESVEELFEAEHGEEAEELQADLTETPETPAVTESVSVAAPAVSESRVPAQQGGAIEITDELIEKIAERVAAKLSEKVLAEIVWQVVPDLAEKMIRRELEKLHAGEN